MESHRRRRPANGLGYNCASLDRRVSTTLAPEGARERLWQLIRDTPNLDWLYAVVCKLPAEHRPGCCRLIGACNPLRCFSGVPLNPLAQRTGWAYRQRTRKNTNRRKEPIHHGERYPPMVHGLCMSYEACRWGRWTIGWGMMLPGMLRSYPCRTVRAAARHFVTMLDLTLRPQQDRPRPMRSWKAPSLAFWSYSMSDLFHKAYRRRISTISVWANRAVITELPAVLPV